MRTSIERYIERRVTSSGVYDSRINFNFQEMGGILGKISTMLEDEAIRNSPYAVKAHLASLELTATRRRFRVARFLFREAPEGYLFSMTDGHKREIPQRERRKLRKAMAMDIKVLKRVIATNLNLAGHDVVYDAFRTGRGVKASFLFGLVDLIKEYRDSRAEFSFD